MKVWLRTCWLGLLVLAGASKSFSTHIMGGDLYYEYLSDDRYRITFQFYIDCENGDPGAISSDIDGNFGFFNAVTKNLIINFNIIRTGPIQVSQLNYDCVLGDPNACVHKYAYSFDVDIDPGDHGIIVSYQRCCRNHTINNIIDPQATGMTIFVEIPPDDQINSSPVFNELPPNFLCNDAPLVFDHSATDPDGDSLSYELYLPYLGATAGAPKPSVPSKPPYSNIQYKAPYHVGNMLGGTQLLEIDETTGLLTALPNKVGQYVVGIKVNEFRNGVKIGETLRDYQFNVLECQKVVQAKMVLPQFLCANRTLTFSSQGSRADTFEWSFNNPGVYDLDTSSTNMELVFTKPGTYTIRLKVRDEGCADSVIQIVTVGELDSLFADFVVKPGIICTGDSIRIERTSDSNPVHWWWDMGDGSPVLKNTEISSYQYASAGKYTVELKMTDSMECHQPDTKYQMVEVYDHVTYQPELSIFATDSCYPGRLTLLQNTDSLPNWTWSIEGVKDSFKQQKSVFNQFETGIYKVGLKMNLDGVHCADYIPKDTTITIEKTGISELKFDLVNIFTPNGDGLNECYDAGEYNTNCVKIKFWIFNRWGECLFRSDEDGMCWDGRNPDNGMFYPPGVYFGIYELQDRDETVTYKTSNTITLIR